MTPLQEYIKLRTEQTRELTHLEVDNNFLYVANPWMPARFFKEGMVVYYGDLSTGGSGNLTWFRANQDNGPSLIFDPSKWDAIGANAISGQIFVKDSNNVINTTSLLEFTDDFIITFTGNNAKVELNPGAVGFWASSPSDSSTIFYDDNVLIGTDTVINPSYKLTVAGNTFITGNLDVSGLIEGIDLVNFFNDYTTHTHTIVPQTLLNYNALYPTSNGVLADANINTATLATDDVLAWDNSIKRWINKTFTGVPHSLGSHTDVDPAVSIAPLNNQILRYNSTSLKWENVTVVLDGSNGFSTAPFAHNHNTLYWTKSQLSAVTGPIINYANIFGAPSGGAPVNASYVVIGNNATLTDERVLTQGTGILIVDSGANLPVTISVVPKTTNQKIEVSKDSVSVGTRSKLNFVTPGSGVTYTITDNPGGDAVNIQVNVVPPVIPPAPVTSVNTFTGAVSLGISELDDVVIVPYLFPGPGVGSPYNPQSNILVYDDDISKWTNVQASAMFAVMANIYLDDILDVEISPTGLFDKNILYYDLGSTLWVNGTVADVDLYTATQLNAGQLNTLYYTKTQLNTSGAGGAVHWLNVTNVPSFAPATHSHYLHKIIDVQDYQFSPPANGHILIWNTGLQLWVPGPNPGLGLSTVVSNYSIAGTYTGATDQTLTPSNVIPLKFQADSGIVIETDTTLNIIKIGTDVDGTTITYNTAGQLTVIGGDFGDNCFTYLLANLIDGVPFTFAHPLGTSDLVVTIYDNLGNIIELDTLVTAIDVTITTAINLTNVKVVLLGCGVVTGGGGGDCCIFDNDITVSLSGGKTLGKYLNGQTIPSAGKTFEEVMNLIAIEEIAPVYVVATIVITDTLPNVDEVGTVYATNTLTATFTQNNAGALTAIRIEKDGSNILPNGVSSPFVKLDSGSYILGDTTYQAFANYNAGPLLNYTPSMTPDARTPLIRSVNAPQAAESNFASSIVKITGYYAEFYGPTASAPLDSLDVRGLPGYRLTNAGINFTLSTGAVEKIFAICLPPGKTLVQVLDTDALNANITANFILTTFSVDDAGGTPHTYNIYVMTNAVPYASNHDFAVTTD